MSPVVFRTEGFCIDTFEVSSKDYWQCGVDGFCHPRPKPSDPYWGVCPEFSPKADDATAAQCLSYDDLAEFCRYRHGRVPDELEWEAAARGKDGRRFPWGDDDARLPQLLGRKAIGLPPRGSMPDWSPLGVADMFAGVREWTATMTVKTPADFDFPSKREWHVIRGFDSKDSVQPTTFADVRHLSKRTFTLPADLRLDWLSGRCVYPPN